MGPITSAATAYLPRRRWLLVALAPAAIAVAVVALRPVTAPAPAPALSAFRTASVVDLPRNLDDIARLHRRWVADHGAGCARSIDHLAPYTSERLGSLHFTCEREAATGTISVEVVAPDGAIGRDSQPIE
jgi:hypothetical protein